MQVAPRESFASSAFGTLAHQYQIVPTAWVRRECALIIQAGNENRIRCGTTATSTGSSLPSSADIPEDIATIQNKSQRLFACSDNQVGDSHCAGSIRVRGGSGGVYRIPRHKLAF